MIAHRRRRERLAPRRFGGTRHPPGFDEVTLLRAAGRRSAILDKIDKVQ